MSPELRELLGIARHYCALIENSGSENEAWLTHVAEILPKLHAAIVSIKVSHESKGEDEVMDLDSRFDLYVQLKGLLGDNDSYWMEFDVTSDSQQMSGSLADDLTDIYYELKHGLDLLTDGTTAEPFKVLEDWSRGYRMHWGQHLLDAERHLYSLDAKGRL